MTGRYRMSYSGLDSTSTSYEINSEGDNSVFLSSTVNMRDWYFIKAIFFHFIYDYKMKGERNHE